ncbi:MAG TPA: FAD-dependent thymidylate synthase [Gemmatimonadetes bacterium]|nr:FAD-dependent thymidylate synthase [Gemmatimonadota bacterium]HCW78652.1 FAD-dependent thymidylate synthase [Gemmatimonadota bacterium]|tara:strand:+ start:243 stop:1220 length:978 start_codon:yes stop_codon:yes gene_type:complete
MDTKRPTNPAAEEILGGYFPVLDHGFVSLVDYMGSDEDVERAARVSYGFGTRKVSQTRGLVRYLRRHRHTTPSEMVEFKFHCAMPMFVARQWIRHRTASVNELSARYSLMPLLFYTPRQDQFELQSRSNKQGREGGASQEVYQEAVRRWEKLRADAGGTYSWMLEEDVARELARIDLPVSTYTQWYWKIDLHNLLHFLSLRVDSRAQWEIQQFGRVIAGMIKRVAPLSYEAWVDYDLGSEPLTRVERHLISSLLEGNEDGLQARDGAKVTADEMKAAGLSTREVAELMEKLSAPSIPDFELDASQMVDADTMARKMYQAVPSSFE